MDLENRLDWADNLRALAIILVILIHVTAPIIYKYGAIPESVWWIGNMANSISRFSVPIFLMLTGSFLLNRDYDLNYYIYKRFSKVILPFIFWSLIYICYNLFVELYKGANFSSTDIIDYLLIKFKTRASFHLWYIYVLVGIYLIIPVIRKWIKLSTDKEIVFYLVIWVLIIICDLPFLDKSLPKFDLRYFSGYLGYVILGYFLSHRLKHQKKRIPLFLIIFGIIFTALGTYLLSKYNKIFSPDLYDYLSINVVITSIGVFMFFKNNTYNNLLLKRVLRVISKYSYGIYLIHVIVLGFLSFLNINWNFITPYIGIPLTTILCLVLSILVIMVINKIPYGKFLLG